MDNDSDNTEQLIQKQWPGFEVKCLRCGSTKVRLDDSRGWSDASGPWGSLDLCCTECDNAVEIAGG